RQGKPLLTLSNGQFAEIHIEKDKVQIGNVIFDTKSRKVVEFVAENSVSESLAGRFLSIDPLASKYPDIAPYAFVMNNPIRYLDPDGRIVVDANGNIIATKVGETTEGDYDDTTYSQNGNEVIVNEIIAKFDVLEIYTNDNTAIKVIRFTGYARKLTTSENGIEKGSCFEPLQDGDMEIIRNIDSEQSCRGTNCHGLTLGRGMLRIGVLEAKKIIEREYTDVTSPSDAEVVLVETTNQEGAYDSHSYMSMNGGDSFLYNDGMLPTIHTKSRVKAQGKDGLQNPTAKISYKVNSTGNRVYKKLNSTSQKNGIRVLNKSEEDTFKKEISKQEK
ncbi:MAG: hypothetical protein ACI81T_001903, partial [Bacteroidia bacterium]